MKSKRATIKDVARRAGVSTATVSFVLNDNPNETISAAARKRVLDAARNLNYHASAAAAGLARKRNGNVGIVFYKDDDTITNAFYSFVVQGAVKAAIERDYNLLFSYVESTYKGYQDLPKIVREKNAEGVLMMRRLHPRMVKDIVGLGIPIVAVDTVPRPDGVNTVQADDRRGGLLAGDYLFQLGHKRVAMLVPRSPAPSIEERLAGFKSAFDKHERRFSRAANVVEAESLTFEAARAAVAKALEKHADLTGLFCSNDEMAAGALRGAHEAGYRVPRDLSIIGFDDIVMCNYTDPPLTTVGAMKEHMGKRAMDRLIELVEKVDDRVKAEFSPVELVVRGSTAKPRARAQR